MLGRLLALALALLLAVPFGPAAAEAMHLSVPGSSAQTAEDLTEACTVTCNVRENVFRLTDGKFKQAYEGRHHQENWIEIAAPEGKRIGGIYLLWTSKTVPVSLDVWNEADQVFEPFEEINRGEYLHEFWRVDGAQRVRLRSLDASGSLPVTEITVLSEGSLPSWVQVWEPPCRDADLMVYLAHPDDEYLFFGGTIPYYAVERGLHVAVVYMTCRNDTRLHELLNGLWTAGVREYPHLMGFIDKTQTLKASTTYKQWGGEDVALDAFAAIVDELKPSVVVTHDLGGEYGHGAHMAVADTALRVIRDGERALDWQPSKLYLHMWEENQVAMDWTQPLDVFGGQSSLDIASAAFQCHESQRGFSVKMKNGKKYRFEVVAGGPLDNGAFGLAYSSVGPDEEKNDFMEHVTPKAR